MNNRPSECCGQEAVKRCAIVGIKAVHSAAFAVIQSAILYMLYKGARRETDGKVAAASAIALGECVVYAANGFRCPLTDLAEKLGSEHGAVTDIFLPKWLAANVARIYTPLLVLAVALHLRNLSRTHSRTGTEASRDLYEVLRSRASRGTSFPAHWLHHEGDKAG
jgi:hypothetical protein